MTDGKPTQAMPPADDTRKGAADGVNSQARHGTTGGESAGAPYPNPHTGKSDADKADIGGGFMSHGGQSTNSYHGSGQLGRDKTKRGGNANAGARED